VIVVKNGPTVSPTSTQQQHIPLLMWECCWHMGPTDTARETGKLGLDFGLNSKPRPCSMFNEVGAPGPEKESYDG